MASWSRSKCLCQVLTRKEELVAEEWGSSKAILGRGRSKYKVRTSMGHREAELAGVTGALCASHACSWEAGEPGGAGSRGTLNITPTSLDASLWVNLCATARVRQVCIGGSLGGCGKARQRRDPESRRTSWKGAATHQGRRGGVGGE